MNNRHLNDSLTAEVGKGIVRRVLEETGFEYGEHPVRFPDEYGIEPRAYCSIKPEIMVYRVGARFPYRHVYIDLRDYPEGVDETCDDSTHRPIRLRWEEGGGGMDSGKPHQYLMCSRCGCSLERKREEIKRATRQETNAAAFRAAIVAIALSVLFALAAIAASVPQLQSSPAGAGILR